MRVFFYYVLAVLWTAAAILGIYAVTGFPDTMPRQIVQATVTALAVQTFIFIWRRRQKRLSHKSF